MGKSAENHSFHRDNLENQDHRHDLFQRRREEHEGDEREDDGPEVGIFRIIAVGAVSFACGSGLTEPVLLGPSTLAAVASPPKMVFMRSGSVRTSRQPSFGLPPPVPITACLGLPDVPRMLDAALVLADPRRSVAIPLAHATAYILAGGERRAIRVSSSPPCRTKGPGGPRRCLLSEDQERQAIATLLAITDRPLRPVLEDHVAAVVGARPNRRWTQRFLRRHGFHMPTWPTVRGRRT